MSKPASKASRAIDSSDSDFHSVSDSDSFDTDSDDLRREPSETEIQSMKMKTEII